MATQSQLLKAKATELYGDKVVFGHMHQSGFTVGNRVMQVGGVAYKGVGNSPWSADTYKEDTEFLEELAKEIAELVIGTDKELDEVAAAEPDESYADRLMRDVKAGAYDKLIDILENLF